MWSIVFIALAFSKTNDELMVTTQVTSLSNGKIQVPSHIDGLVVEMGCSDRNTADEEILPLYSNAYLVSFEPMLDKYAVLLARGTKRLHGAHKDRAVPLGKHHDRGTVLPFAISLTGGPLKMHISKVAGCSSLLRINPNTKWGRFCLQSLENRTVDTLRMEDAIRLLPDNIPIHFFKLDVQGMDGALIKRIPLQVLARVQKLQFESVTNRCNNLYENQMRCGEIETYLREHGFQGNCPYGCEVTPTFTNMRSHDTG